MMRILRSAFPRRRSPPCGRSILLVSDEVPRRALGITALLAFVVQLVVRDRAGVGAEAERDGGVGIGIALRFAALLSSD